MLESSQPILLKIVKLFSNWLPHQTLLGTERTYKSVCGKLWNTMWSFSFSCYFTELLLTHMFERRGRAGTSLREVKVVGLRRGGPAVWMLHCSRAGVYCMQREWKQKANELIANKWSRVSSFVCASCITLVLVCFYYVCNYECELTLGFGKELWTVRNYGRFIFILVLFLDSVSCQLLKHITQFIVYK